MTRYEELGQACSQAVGRSREYEQDSINFAAKLLQELRNFLQCPAHAMTPEPIDGGEEEQARMVGPMELRKDGFWHFGLGLTVEAPNTLPPEHHLLLHIMFRGKDAGYVIKIQPDSPELHVRNGQDGDFQPIGDAVFRLVKDYFDSGLDRFLEKSSSRRKVGF